MAEFIDAYPGIIIMIAGMMVYGAVFFPLYAYPRLTAKYRSIFRSQVSSVLSSASGVPHLARHRFLRDEKNRLRVHARFWAFDCVFEYIPIHLMALSACAMASALCEDFL